MKPDLDALLAAARREERLLIALREICAGKMPEDYGRFDVCCARMIGIAQRAITEDIAKEIEP